MAPYLFVVLWSTGFIFVKLGASDAEPFTFLAIRHAIVAALMTPIVLYLAPRRLAWRERGHAAVAGILMHAVYLGGVVCATRRGMPAGLVALIVSLQPVVTAVAAGPLLGETVTVRHWVGLAVGLAGTALVLQPKLAVATTGIDAAGVASCLVALAGMTAGTLYQKRFATGIDLLGGAVWQSLGALAVVALGAVLFETRQVAWTPAFVTALAWLVLVLSIGAILLLMYIIRHNGVARVSSVFYLVPVTAALMAWAMFGETLQPVQFAGMALVTLAVVLIRPAAARD